MIKTWISQVNYLLDQLETTRMDEFIRALDFSTLDSFQFDTKEFSAAVTRIVARNLSNQTFNAKDVIIYNMREENGLKKATPDNLIEGGNTVFASLVYLTSMHKEQFIHMANPNKKQEEVYFTQLSCKYFSIDIFCV